MRKSPFAIALGLGAALAVACAGKNAKDVDIGFDASPLDSGSDFPLPFPDGAFAELDAAPVDSGARIYDAGEPVTLDGDIPCVVGGAMETEPNNSDGTANELAPTVCGYTDPATESEWLHFTLKNTTKHMYLGYAGNIKLTVRVDGKSVELSPQSAPPVPFVRGKRYTVQVESFDTSPQKWRVTLFEFDQ